RQRMAEVNQGKYEIDVKEQFYSNTFWAAFSYGEIAATIIVLMIGVNGVATGTLTVGTLVLFFEYIRQLFQPIAALSEQLNFINRGFISIERVFGILETEPSVKDVGFEGSSGTGPRARHSSSPSSGDLQVAEDAGR